MMRAVLLAALALVLFPTAAAAEPVSALIGVITATIKAGGIAGALLKMAGSFALSFLAQKLMGKPKQPGQEVSAPTTGDAQSESFVVGRWATGGHFIYHGSHGQEGDTPNAYYQRVFELSGMKGARLRAFIMDSRYVQFEDPIADSAIATTTDDDGAPAIDGDQSNRLPVGDTVAGGDTDYGLAATNPQFVKGSQSYFWLKWWDGSQTAADAQLVDAYGTGDRAWTSAMVGEGIVYAVLTWRYSREVWQRGIPEVRFVIEGLPLYDPRADTSVGGDGAQRWDDPSTWAYTENPIVIAYNVARGIALPDGTIYGGAYPDADQLPVDNWVAAMNVCDETVAKDGGGFRKRYKFGAEVRVAETAPADLMDACATACSGEYAPRGGKLYVHAGPPAVQTLSITDDDISASDPESFDPILGLAERYNAVAITHVDPRLLWEASNINAERNATWEAEDGGRFLPADLRLSGVFSRGQASELGDEYIKDARRERRHQFALPPEYARLKCLDTISWTSARNGYDAKLFEVVAIEQRVDNLFCLVTLRERDPDDYDWSTDPALLPEVVAPSRTPAQAVPGFGGVGVALPDANGDPRRPALSLVWAEAEARDVELLQYEVRLAGETELVASGVEYLGSGALLVTSGIIGAENYQARAQLIADRATDWSAWIDIAAPDVRIGSADLDPALSGEISAASQAALVADTNLSRTVPGTPNTSPGWAMTDGVGFINDGVALIGSYSIAAFTTTGSAIVAQNLIQFDVAPGDTYRVGCSIWRGSFAAFDNMRVGLRFYDANDSGLADGWVDSGDQTQVASETWEALSGLLTVPASAAKARLVVAYENKTTGGTLRWDAFQCRRGDGQTLISPGGITAPMINVENLSAVSANIGLLRSAATGERVEIQDDKISVFDSTGQLRVRIGDLS